MKISETNEEEKEEEETKPEKQGKQETEKAKQTKQEKLIPSLDNLITASNNNKEEDKEKQWFSLLKPYFDSEQEPFLFHHDDHFDILSKDGRLFNLSHKDNSLIEHKIDNFSDQNKEVRFFFYFYIFFFFYLFYRIFFFKFFLFYLFYLFLFYLI